MKLIVTSLALMLSQLACSGEEGSSTADESGVVTVAQELRHGGGHERHAWHHSRATEVSYSYSFNGVSGSTCLARGRSFTIWDDLGGCGVESRDVAICESDRHGRVRAFNHDCLAADGPGTFGPWVREGCSVAEDFGFTVECCIIPDDESDVAPGHGPR